LSIGEDGDVIAFEKTTDEGFDGSPNLLLTFVG
jgi:hypothetical protein